MSASVRHYIRAYERRADAREAERLQRFERLRERAAAIARSLREAYGARVVLFGSLLDRDHLAPNADIDLAVEGLSPSEYWEAWEGVERFAGDARLDFIRLEWAPPGLQELIREEGVELG